MDVARNGISVRNPVSFGGGFGSPGDVLVSRGASFVPVWSTLPSDKTRIELLQSENYTLQRNPRAFTFLWIKASGSHVVYLPSELNQESLIFIRNDSDSPWRIDTNRAGLIYHGFRPNGSFRLPVSASITLSAAPTALGDSVSWVVVADQNMSSPPKFMLTCGITNGASTGNVVITKANTIVTSFQPKSSDTRFFLVYEGTSNVWSVTNRGYLTQNGVAVDGDGNILVCGVVIDGRSSSVVFNSTDGSTTSLTYPSSPYNMYPGGFLLKYSKTGVVQWASSFVSLFIYNYFQYNPINVSRDNNNSVYISGSSGGIMTFSNSPPLANVGIPYNGAESPFLTKYNEDGSIAWVTKVISSYVGTHATKTWHDNLNDVYVLMSPYIGDPSGVDPTWFEGFVDRLSEPLTITLFNSNLDNYAPSGKSFESTQSNISLIVKYDSDTGNPVWFTPFQGTFGSTSSTVNVARKGNVFFFLMACRYVNPELSSVVLTGTDSMSYSISQDTGNENMHVFTKLTMDGVILNSIKIAGTRVLDICACNLFSDNAIYSALPCSASTPVNFYIENNTPFLSITGVAEASFCIVSKHNFELNVTSWIILGNAYVVDSIEFDDAGNVVISTQTLKGAPIVVYKPGSVDEVVTTVNNPVVENVAYTLRYVIVFNVYFKVLSYEVNSCDASQLFSVAQQSVHLA
jgi:hypothetical protein